MNPPLPQSPVCATIEACSQSAKLHRHAIINYAILSRLRDLDKGGIDLFYLR